MATRYRCTACGNLTRFDVVSTRRTRAYHHFTVGGDLRIEDENGVARRPRQAAQVAARRHAADEHALV